MPNHECIFSLIMFKFCDVIKKSSLFKDYNQCKTNKKSQNTVVRRFFSMSVSHLLMQIFDTGILFNAESDSGGLGFGLRFCITNECPREADIVCPQTTR